MDSEDDRRERVRRTSHLRSKVEVFVKAFFARNAVASFLAARMMGSVSILDDVCRNKNEHRNQEYCGRNSL